MGEMIGRGRNFLKKKVDACISADGVPLIRTHFAGDRFRSKVIFACWGAADQVSGGTIKGLSPGLISKIKEADTGYKVLTEREAHRNMGIVQRLKGEKRGSRTRGRPRRY